MTEVVGEAAPGFPLAVLSGPSFAADVAAGLPTAVTLAAADAALAAALADALQGPNLRLYDSDDPRGVEIGGAAKNVLAIACGAAAGLGLGASASAALVARGFAELGRFGAAYGARPATLMGLAGLGDLVLTCASPQSRNFAFGFDLGRGLPPAQAGGGRLAEGAFTAPALLKLAQRARRRHADRRRCRRGARRRNHARGTRWSCCWRGRASAKPEILSSCSWAVHVDRGSLRQDLTMGSSTKDTARMVKNFLRSSPSPWR